MKGVAKVGACNCDDEVNKAFCGQFGVQGFPTLKIVKPGKKPGRPVVDDYKGARDAKAIVEAVQDKITNHVKRLKSDTLGNWVEDGTRPKAILFSEKGTTAPLVKALAIDFLGSIDFAQVRNKEADAVDKYDVTKFPTLVLVQGEEISKYDGEISKDALVKFLSQAASPNPDPAPKQEKAKSAPTKKPKSASASSKFSKASEKHKSSEFDEYLDHASTIVLSDDMPTASPMPIVEHEQKPMVVADAPAPLPTLETSNALRTACLKADSSHCVLVLLPKKADADAGYSGNAADALSGFATIEDKYSKRKANIFPAYAIPAENVDSSIIRETLKLKSDDQVDIVVLNRKKGWAKTYSKSTYDLQSIESFMDDIRFGEGTKQKLPSDFFVDPVVEAPTESVEDADAQAEDAIAEDAKPSGHDEL